MLWWCLPVSVFSYWTSRKLIYQKGDKTSSVNGAVAAGISKLDTIFQLRIFFVYI